MNHLIETPVSAIERNIVGSEERGKRQRRKGIGGIIGIARLERGDEALHHKCLGSAIAAFCWAFNSFGS